MILQQILEIKKEEVLTLREIYQQKNLLQFIEELQTLNHGKNFYHSLKKSKKAIIAECKKASPSLGLLKENYDPVSIAKQYESLGASAISILTDKKFFMGSMEDLQKVSKNVEIPVLRKDFIISKEQILEAKLYGANAILLILRILKPEEFKELFEFAYILGLDCLVEIHNENELELALQYPVKIIGINHRDLDTLKMNLNLSFQLAPKIKQHNKNILVIAESGIEDADKIEALYNYVDGFLIGTYFMKSEEITNAWNKLFSKVMLSTPK